MVLQQDQSVIAPEDLAIDNEGGDAEGTGLDCGRNRPLVKARRLGIIDKGNQPLAVEPSFIGEARKIVIAQVLRTLPSDGFK